MKKIILQLVIFQIILNFAPQAQGWISRRRTVRTTVKPITLPPAPCKRYRMLSDVDRSALLPTPDKNKAKCDKDDLTKGWYRFGGPAGKFIATKCPPENYCNTHAPGWMVGTLPSTAEGIVTRKICFHFYKDCCKWNKNIRVKNCNGFYVYELDKTPYCRLRYCGAGIDGDDCAKKPCKNGAKCIDGFYSYECKCAVGYTGKHCETKSVRPTVCPTGDSVGCFRDSSLLPELLFTDTNEKSAKYSGVTVDWVNWKNYLANLTCRCAYSARKLGYEVFGLKTTGECWSNNATKWKSSNKKLAMSCTGRYYTPSPKAQQDVCSWGVDIYYVYELLHYDVRVTRASVKDYISITRKRSSLTSLSICTWIKTEDERAHAAFISYAEKGGSSNGIVLNNPKALWFWIGTQWKTGVSLTDGRWHHVCVTWENAKGQTAVFKDGRKLATHTFKKGHVIKGEGILIIGQEQDSYGGKFSASQNFIGDLHGINIWDEVLGEATIKAMALDSKMDIIGSVVSWDDVISGCKYGDVLYVNASCKNVNPKLDIRVSTRASVKDYIKITTKQFPSMTALTLCLWLKTTDKRSDATMISYAAKGSYNEVVLNIPNSLSFWIASSRWKTGVHVADDIWHHVCVTWENTAGQAAIFKDGNKTGSYAFKKGHVVKDNGILIVGQEQDKFGGGFQSSQNFIGDIYGINIWDRVLTDGEINIMAIDATSDVYGNVLEWMDLPCQDVYGETKFIKPSFCKMPNASPGWYVLFDFEQGPASLSTWTKTGTAFNNQPTYGDNPNARKRGSAKLKGNWWIGTAENRPSASAKAGGLQGDKPIGTITSPYFKITGTKLRFLIGGGCNSNLVRAELLIEGNIVATATIGKCSETMVTHEWEVGAKYFGQRAQVCLIDSSSSGWAHINFDHFEMWYEPWTANYDIQFNRLSQEDYVRVGKTLPMMTELTYCFWIKTSDQTRERTIFSYFLPNANYEIIMYNPKKLTFHSTHQQMVISNVNVADNRWHHVCITWNSATKSAVVFKDGWVSQKITTTKSGPWIKPGGSLVIGQLQTGLNGGFRNNWNYIGSIYGFNIWDKVLSDEEINTMALNPHKEVSGNAIGWGDVMCDAVLGETKLIRKSSCRRLDGNFDVNFTRASVEDYIDYKRHILAPVTRLTLCVWLKTADQREASTIFSYAAGKSYNEILLNRPKSLLFWVGSKYWSTGVNVADNRWHYVCVTWENTVGQAALILDGKQVSRGLLKPKHVFKPMNGSFIVGQEQDKVGGGFQSTQNFIGELSRINLWDTVLVLWQIEAMSLSPNKADQIEGAHGNVLKWSDAFCGSSISGETQVIDPPTSCKNLDVHFDIKFTRATVEDYVQITRPVPSMTALTLCVWIKTVDTRVASSIVSYAVIGSSNEVVLNEPKALLFWIGGSVWKTGLKLADGKWHHICVTWENAGGQAAIFKDGKQAGKHAYKKGHVIKANGALIIGQEQDKVGGGFQAKQNYIGELSGLNIWTKVLGADEIMTMAIDYRNNAAGDLLRWSDVFCEKKMGETKLIKPALSCKFISASTGWRVLFDFEDGGLSKWSLSGTAFNNQPTYGDNPKARKREPSKHNGNWWIGSAENRPSAKAKAGVIQGDGPRGEMISPPFRLTGTKLKFLVGAGCSKTKSSVFIDLLSVSSRVPSTIIFTRPALCKESMVEVEWNINARYIGTMARVRLVDNNSGGWGHINFDHLMIYDPAPVWTVLYDFEKGAASLKTWTKTGTVFNNQPTYGDNTKARKRGSANVNGAWWIGGAENRPSVSAKAGGLQGDKPKGTLTSPSFLITGYKLRFLIGGGCDINVVRVELEVEEKIVAKATGKCSEAMAAVEWDISCYLGKSAMVRAVDSSSAGWAHINFDHIEMFSIVNSKD